MAKRFLDTGFLNQKWIRKLKPKHKCFLIYSMLRCDNGGILEFDVEDVEHWIGEKIGNVTQFLPKDYLILIQEPDKFFIPKFIEWQYPNFPHSKVHQQKQAKEILTKYGIYNPDTQEINLPNIYPKVTQPLPDGQVIVNANGNADDNVNGISFEIFWNLYDKKVGSKRKCEKKWDSLKNEIKQLIIDTLPAFKIEHPDKKYRPNPETYLNNERWNDEIIGNKSKLDEHKESYQKSLEDLI